MTLNKHQSPAAGIPTHSKSKELFSGNCCNDAEFLQTQNFPKLSKDKTVQVLKVLFQNMNTCRLIYKLQSVS